MSSISKEAFPAGAQNKVNHDAIFAFQAKTATISIGIITDPLLKDVSESDFTKLLKRDNLIKAIANAVITKAKAGDRPTKSFAQTEDNKAPEQTIDRSAEVKHDANMALREATPSIIAKITEGLADESNALKTLKDLIKREDYIEVMVRAASEEIRAVTKTISHKPTTNNITRTIF